MKLLVPVSSTTCHTVHVPTVVVWLKITLTKASCSPNQSNSTRIQSRKLPLNDISRVTDVFHNAA